MYIDLLKAFGDNESVVKSDFVQKRSILFHTCAICSERPSYISTMEYIVSTVDPGVQSDPQSRSGNDNKIITIVPFNCNLKGDKREYLPTILASLQLLVYYLFKHENKKLNNNPKQIFFGPTNTMSKMDKMSFENSCVICRRIIMQESKQGSKGKAPAPGTLKGAASMRDISQTDSPSQSIHSSLR